MVFSRTRRNIRTWTAPIIIVLVLARICSTDPHSHRPQYDHQHRDYYVIRISDPQQIQDLQDYHTFDQQHHHVLGDLLSLRFESRVGSLPDYFLYSILKSSPPHHHHLQGQDHINRTESFSEEKPTSSHLQKRHLDTSHLGSTQGHAQGVSLNTVDDIDDASDPVIQRFFLLKERHERHLLPSQQQQPHSKTKRDMSVFLFSDDASSKSARDDDLLALRRSGLGMQDIQKQRLRQRIKKRAPLPEPPMPMLLRAAVVQKAERGEDEGDESDPEADDREQEEAEIEAELESDQEEQDLEAVVEEEGEQSGKDEGEDEDEDEDGEQEGGEEEEEGEEETEEETSENESENDDPRIEYQPAGESQPDDGLAEAFGIEDPGFRYQWHLVSSKSCRIRDQKHRP